MLQKLKQPIVNKSGNVFPEYSYHKNWSLKIYHKKQKARIIEHRSYANFREGSFKTDLNNVTNIEYQI